MKSLLKVNMQTLVASPEKVKCDALVLPVFQDGALFDPTKKIDQILKGLIKKIISQKEFDPEKDKTFWLESKEIQSPRIILVSLGSRKDYSRNILRDAYATVSKELTSRRMSCVGVPYFEDKTLANDWDAAIEGFLLSTYQFDRYLKKTNEKKSQKKDQKNGMTSLVIAYPDSKTKTKFEKAITQVKVHVQATFLARDLINEPANVANPTYVSKMAQAIAREQHFHAKVIGEAELKKLKMNLIVAVGMGSIERPRLVHLEYRPSKRAKKTVALVGKGVTFDSGGLSLKPQPHMYGMKSDMSGAASVLATMWAIAELKLPVHVHALLPLVENLPSHNSVKPGDVFVGRNGKSVEIENTDAEGRLVLADALTYVESLKVDCVIDVATLTGACVIALGDDIAGIMGTDQKLMDEVMKASEHTGEKFWQLPLEKSYKRMLKSDVADLKNVGGKYGGSITAGLFLSEFVPENIPWAHLDIAGPAFIDREWPISSKGGTGFPVRTFLRFLENYN